MSDFFKKTDTVVMEYCKLPIIDTTIRFLHRFKTPFETCWTEDCLTLAAMSWGETIESHGLNRYLDSINETSKNQNWPATLDWAKDIKKIQLIECEIVPKVKLSDE